MDGCSLNGCSFDVPAGGRGRWAQNLPTLPSSALLSFESLVNIANHSTFNFKQLDLCYTSFMHKQPHILDIVSWRNAPFSSFQTLKAILFAQISRCLTCSEYPQGLGLPVMSSLLPGPSDHYLVQIYLPPKAAWTPAWALSVVFLLLFQNPSPLWPASLAVPFSYYD